NWLQCCQYSHHCSTASRITRIGTISKPDRVGSAPGFAQAESILFGVAIQVPGNLMPEGWHQSLPQLDKHHLHDLILGIPRRRSNSVTSQIFNLAKRHASEAFGQI